MAVEFIYAHPDEAAAIVAKAYNIDLATARMSIRNLTAPPKPGHLPYWGSGRFDMAGMKRMIAAQKMVGGFSGSIDLNKIIDRRFLPADLQKDY